MNVFTYSEWVLYIAICSVFGWICETIWCSVPQKKFVNRGFFYGPWCPIYGFGATVILLCALPFQRSPVLVFLIAMLAASLLEYFSGWMLEALFKTRWWDYSNNRFHIKGRVCLLNSIMFGLMGIVSVYGVYPWMQRVLNAVPSLVRVVSASVIVVLFTADLVRSVSAASKLQARVEGVKETVEELRHMQQEYQWYDKTDLRGSVARLQNICMEEPDKQELAQALARMEEIFKRERSTQRLLRAFPQIHFKDLDFEFDTIREAWLERRKEMQNLREKIKQHHQKAKAETKSAYQGFTFDHIVWMFFIGCIAGYIVEMLFCLVKNGYIESRQGMLYGPFSQIYGFGAVIIALVLLPLAKRGDIFTFVGGGFIGGAFEALCSVVQESLLGTVSWEYNEHSFSMFGGRTSLLYMVFWGILSLFYMKKIYPKICKIIQQIPKRPKHTLSIIIAIVLTLDIALSAVAVARWAQRDAGESADNAVAVWLDEMYPDEKMQEVYPNMKIVG